MGIFGNNKDNELKQVSLTTPSVEDNLDKLEEIIETLEKDESIIEANLEELKSLQEQINTAQGGRDHSDIPLIDPYYSLRESLSPRMHVLQEMIKNGVK